MTAARPRVVIVGGGITGLSAAFHLVHADFAPTQRPEVLVIEADEQVGGSIRTLHRDGCIIETGPDALPDREGELRALIRAVGLGDELIAARTRRFFVYSHGRLRPFPAGTLLGIPTQVLPFARTSLVSPAGKLRAARDLLRPGDGVDGDESLGACLRRRLGNAWVDGLVDPLVSGIHGESLDGLSLHATAPFNRLCQDGRSLILTARKWQAAAHRTAGGERRARFLSLRQGLQSLPRAVARRLPEHAMRCGIGVERIERDRSCYRVVLRDGSHVDADAVILAVPAHVAGALTGLAAAFGPLGRARGSALAMVHFGFPAAALHLPQTGSGFVVAASANLALTACTWSHLKWPHAAPRGRALLRCSVAGAHGSEAIDQPDDELVARVLRDLGRIMRIDGRPDLSFVTRRREGIPRYAVGHLEHVAQARAALAKALPGVTLAGASYGGASLDACVRQGERAAATVLRELATRDREALQWRPTVTPHAARADSASGRSS